MIFKKTKTIEIEFELIKAKRHNDTGTESIYVFKDINDIFGVEDKIFTMTSYNIFSGMDCDMFYDKNGRYIDVCSFKEIYSIFEDEFELCDSLIKTIYDYLKINNLPYRYLDTDPEGYRNISEDIHRDYQEGITKHKAKPCIVKLDGRYIKIPAGTSWSYKNGVLTLSNSHLTTEGDVDMTNISAIDEIVLEFNRFWNDTVDGNYMWR